MNKKHQKRLLNVARSLRESPNPRKFTMESFVIGDDGEVMTGPEKNFCGTPACALGHYGSRGDLQKFMKVKIEKETDSIWSYEKGAEVKVPGLTAHLVYKKGDGWDVSGRGEIYAREVYFTDPRVLEHFGIGTDEAEELFGPYGCGHAKSAKQAAKYIERFVADHAGQNKGKLVPRDSY